MFKKITGTFLDEITCDIASQNWTEEDWRNDFKAMAGIGIDTVIIIRGGFRNEAVFPSITIGNKYSLDLAQLFLDLAQKHGMRLFFGTYDTGQFFDRHIDPQDEFQINKRFITEVLERYGGHPALRGWYLCQEPHSDEPGIKEYYYLVSSFLKEKTPNAPILISPFFPSRDALGKAFLSPERFKESWGRILQKVNGLVNYIAFQDGTCQVYKLGGYLKAASEFCREAGVELWGNAELFERSASFNFPPVDYRRLIRRLEIASPYVSKMISFEFSHFMSPNADFPSARRLYDHYVKNAIENEEYAVAQRTAATFVSRET